MAVNRRFLLAGVRHEILISPRSLEPIFRVIAWSMNATWHTKVGFDGCFL